jgi:hypothetical protein
MRKIDWNVDNIFFAVFVVLTLVIDAICFIKRIRP